MQAAQKCMHHEVPVHLRLTASRRTFKHDVESVFPFISSPPEQFPEGILKDMFSTHMHS